MSESLFWLSDEAWSAIEPQLPTNQRGPRRVDDRRVISGIVHTLLSGGRWQDCPSDYGPAPTMYTRWRRWSRTGIWSRIQAALGEAARIGAIEPVGLRHLPAGIPTGRKRAVSAPPGTLTAVQALRSVRRPVPRSSPRAPAHVQDRAHRGARPR